VANPAAIRSTRGLGLRKSEPESERESEIDDRREPFGMPFTNREVAVIVANQLNRHDSGLWFYQVERHIDEKRWIIMREGRVEFIERHCEPRQAGRTRDAGPGQVNFRYAS
jgi:hypothetical protein